MTTLPTARCSVPDCAEPALNVIAGRCWCDAHRPAAPGQADVLRAQLEETARRLGREYQTNLCLIGEVERLRARADEQERLIDDLARLGCERDRAERLHAKAVAVIRWLRRDVLGGLVEQVQIDADREDRMRKSLGDLDDDEGTEEAVERVARLMRDYRTRAEAAERRVRELEAERARALAPPDPAALHGLSVAEIAIRGRAAQDRVEELEAALGVIASGVEPTGMDGDTHRDCAAALRCCGCSGVGPAPEAIEHDEGCWVALARAALRPSQPPPRSG